MHGDLAAVQLVEEMPELGLGKGGVELWYVIYEVVPKVVEPADAIKQDMNLFQAEVGVNVLDQKWDKAGFFGDMQSWVAAQDVSQQCSARAWVSDDEEWSFRNVAHLCNPSRERRRPSGRPA